MGQRSSLVLAALLVLSLVLVSGVGLLDGRAAVLEEDNLSVTVSGLRLPDSVRYAVLLNKPPEQLFRDLRVEIGLPAEAELVEALEAADLTEFLGLQDHVLSWAAPAFGPDNNVAPFAFTLREAASAPLDIRVRWTGNPPGDIHESVQPPLSTATSLTGERTLGEQDSAGPVPIGDSGVLAVLPVGGLPEGTVLRVRRLGPDANPPVEGDLWWCAEVEIDGLPAGTSLDVLVPLRSPLPAAQELVLFAQGQSGWEELSIKGHTTSDGQYAAFSHSGGVVAVGAVLCRPPLCGNDPRGVGRPVVVAPRPNPTSAPPPPPPPPRTR